jgi:tetratricopeptide (TPR) repeat protein
MSRASWLLLAALALGAGCARDEAERLYRSALEGEETGMGRLRQIALLTEAIAHAPTRAWYYETRAIYEIDLQDFEAAHRDLDQAIALADRPYLRFLRGLVRSESTRFAAALDDFTLAITRESGNAQFYRGRGLALAALGRFDEALADADQLMRLAPQQAESWYVRGVARQGLGRHADAVDDFSAAIRMRPELVFPLQARARSHAALGDPSAERADVAAADAVRRQHPGCRLCDDPFRY